MRDFIKILIVFLVLLFAGLNGLPLRAQNARAAEKGTQSGKTVPALPASFHHVILKGNSPGGFAGEYELFHLDTLFNIVNRGLTRVYGEINGRRFILTTIPEEITRGDYVFLIPSRDTVLIDIAPYINPGFFDTTPLQLLSEGPAGSSADIIIGDESARLKNEIDFVLELDSHRNGDANNDGFTHEREDQFVEILNTNGEAVDISGWRIIMDSRVWHVFPSGTVIEAGRFVVVFGGGVPREIPGQVFTANHPGSNSAPGLKYQSGNIQLITAAAQVSDSLSYSFPEAIAQSFTRHPDGTGEFVLHTSAITSGRELYSPGKTATGDTALPETVLTNSGVRINEIHTDPAADDPLFPSQIQLLDNYPNPFNNQTVIRFTVPEEFVFGADVRLSIFNSLGQKISALVSGKSFPGTIEIRWNGTNARGEAVASGIYIAQLLIGKTQKTHRLILLR